MAITIVVEDGTGKSDANSYISVADARSYATNRGIALPANDDDIAAMLINSTDYLQTFECEYVGYRTTDVQALSWPRTDAYYGGDIYGKLICGPNEIPTQIKSAQNQAVIAQQNGFVLMPNYSAADFVTEETVGPITTKYANPLSVGVMPTLSSVSALLAPLFGKCPSGSMLKTVRV